MKMKPFVILNVMALGFILFSFAEDGMPVNQDEIKQSNSNVYSLRGREHKANSELALFYLSRAKQRKEDGDLDAAQADFVKARLFDSRLASEYESLSKPQNARKWMIKARDTLFVHEKIHCYKKAIECDPNFAKAYIMLGKTLIKRKDYLKAQDAFEKVLEIDPYSKKAQKYLKKVKKKLRKKPVAD